jgi:signal transduction histidine kinase
MIQNRQSGFSINKRYLKPNGSIIWANVTIAPYDYGIDSNPCYLCMVEDITEQKLRDLALREAEERERLLLKEAVEFKDSFITLITHEFKTPITIINAALQTMEIVCKRDITNSMMKYLNKIKQNSLRQQRLVDNLLDVTRIKAGRFNINPKYVNVFSITKEIVESVEVFALQKGISLMFYSNVESEIILIDWQIYERIVLNLLSNAVKFSPENGKIYIRLSVNNDRLEFRVRDQGLGIPIDKQRVIFEQFGQVNSSFSRQAEGTGIGLYLVKLLVDELKGAISLKSYEKKGSIFTVTLPIQDFTISETSQAVQLDSVKQIANKEFSDIINVGTIC